VNQLARSSGRHAMRILCIGVGQGIAPVLQPFAPVGVRVGVKLARRIPPALFFRLGCLGVFPSGPRLVWDAFR